MRMITAAGIVSAAAIDLTELAPCDPDSSYRHLSASARLEEHFYR
jgi:hypothetical protein